MPEAMTFVMKCLGCGYKYEIQLSQIYEWEICPICGYGNHFWEFCSLKEEVPKSV